MKVSTQGRKLTMWMLFLLAFGILCWFWYRNQFSGAFHFFNDAYEWAFLDKLGHLWCTYFLSSIIYYGVYEGKSHRISASIQAFLMVSSLELADAFSIDYGFSIYDVVANGSGALLAYAAPYKNDFFKLKFSFWPSGMAQLRPEMLGSNWTEQWLKDYNGQTYWVSLPIAVFVKHSRIPQWLGCSFGYGAQGMLYAPPSLNPELAWQWYLGPDILFSRIQTKKNWLRTLLLIIDVVKLPFGSILWQSGLGFGWSSGI